MTDRNVIALSKCKTEENEPWEAKKEEICEKAFEETRRCLLNSYHSYVQTHAAYMIALVIGLLTLISSFAAFFKSFYWIIAFLYLVAGILLAYVILRTTYWTYYASKAITLTLDDAIMLFNKHNKHRYESKKPYYPKTKNPPYTAILQIAIAQNLIDDWHAKDLPWPLRLLWRLHLIERE
jgi:hypothetical protein